jgi:hypothetical protein
MPGAIMSDVNFTTTFTVDRTPEEAFAAINNVHGWWSGNIDGDTHKLGGEQEHEDEGVSS